MRTLTITATIPLEDDIMADALTISALREPAEAFSAAILEAGGEPLTWRQGNDIANEAPKVRRGRPRLTVAAE